jgi:nitroreductase
MENILSRRSIRRFLDKPVEKEKLDEILTAALWAPSGMNRQTWQFTAVTNRGKLKTFYETIAKVLGRENYDFYNAAALVIPSNDRESRWGKEDNACAMENIFLAARSLGVGSVWLNQLQEISDNGEIRAILTEFGIPAQHVVYGMAALGYAAPGEGEKIPPRKGILKIVE